MCLRIDTVDEMSVVLEGLDDTRKNCLDLEIKLSRLLFDLSVIATSIQMGELTIYSPSSVSEDEMERMFY